MRVVLAEHVTDDAGAFSVSTVPMHLLLVHRVENAPVDRFEAVPHVRNGSPDDHAHRVIEVRAPHLVFECHRMLLWRFRHELLLPRVVPQSCDAGAKLPRAHPPCTHSQGFGTAVFWLLPRKFRKPQKRAGAGREMDTAMRDLERIEERSSDEGRGVLVLSGVGLVAAIAVVVGAVAALPDGSQSQPEDPLQMLAVANEVEADEAAHEPAPEPGIDPETLSFPTTLVTETRPEVAAAMAAAAAELAHLDPVTKPPPRSDIAAGLPAAVTAGPDRKIVEMAAIRDPLVAAAVPGNTISAPAGHEGRYTLQVISYRDAARGAGVRKRATQERSRSVRDNRHRRRPRHPLASPHRPVRNAATGARLSDDLRTRRRHEHLHRPQQRLSRSDATERDGRNCSTGERHATHVLASGTRSAVSLRRTTASLPPTRCAAHREPFSCVEVDVRRGVVCDVLGINPLKKGTVPFS